MSRRPARRGRALAPSLVALSVLAACSDEAILSPPVRSGARSVVVAFVDGSGAIAEPTAAEASAGAWTVRAPLDRAQGVLVLYYDRPLTALDLQAGPVVGTDQSPCTRLVPDEVWRAEALDAPFVRTALPPSLAERLAPGGRERCGHCQTFIETRLDIPGQNYRLDAAAPLSDGSVLAIDDTGALLVLDHDGVEAVPGCPGARYESVVGFASDQFYLGTYEGRIHHVAVDARARTCRLVIDRTTTTTRTFEWLVTSPTGDELFGLDVSGHLHHGRGSGPLEPVLEVAINDLKFSREGGINRAGLVWLGPGRVVVSGSAPEAVWWVDGRVVRKEAIASQLNDSVSEIEAFGGAVYVGNGHGQIVRFGDDDTVGQPLPDNPLREIVGSIVPHKDGLLVTSGEGVIGSWYPTVGWCPVHVLAGVTDRGRHAFVDEAGDLFITDMIGGPGSQAQVVWLRGRD